jgi:hypothetical protein
MAGREAQTVLGKKGADMRLRALLIMCVALAGCDSNPAQPTCTYTLSATSLTMSAAGGTGSISVATGSGCSWTASSAVPWITATGGTSTTGPGTFTFSVAASASTASRTGGLTVANQAVAVTQQGLSCAYALVPASRTVDAAGATATFDVATDAACGWTVASTVPWLTIVAGGSGSGNATVTYRAAANPDTAPRTGSLTVGDASHVVTQAGLTSCTVDISRSGDNFAVAGGNGSFDVTAPSTCAWLAVSNASWVRITDPAGGAGTGSRRVTYVVDANSGAGARTATIAVGGKSVTVNQAGTTSCEYAVAPVEVKACMSVGYVTTIAVATGAGCPWTSSTPASWITISSGLSGTGPGSIMFSIASNYDAARQANVEVRWPTPTAGQNVRVAQAGCLYGVSKDTFDVPAAGGDFSFDVVSQSTDVNCGGPLQNGCMWSAAPSATWVTVLSPMPRFGDDRVSFRVAANTTGSARTSTITVRDKTVTIRQAGS